MYRDVSAPSSNSNEVFVLPPGVAFQVWLGIPLGGGYTAFLFLTKTAASICTKYSDTTNICYTSGPGATSGPRNKYICSTRWFHFWYKWDAPKPWLSLSMKARCWTFVSWRTDLIWSQMQSWGMKRLQLINRPHKDNPSLSKSKILSFLFFGSFFWAPCVVPARNPFFHRALTDWILLKSIINLYLFYFVGHWPVEIAFSSWLNRTVLVAVA